MSAFPLNEQQKAAATTLEGPVLITAGAGSGKTRVLTERAANAVLEGAVPGWRPAGIDRVLAITYTDKAAGELAERTRGALRAAGAVSEARRVDAAWISTIHGLCSRLLRSEALFAGMDPTFSVADAVQAGALRAEALESAARELIETNGGTSALLALHGLDSIAGIVMRLGDRMRVRGLSSTLIAIPARPDVDALVGEAARFFRDNGGYFEGCDPSATAAGPHGEACGRIAADLEELATAGLDETELAAVAWRALAAHEMPGVSKGVGDRVKEIKRLRVQFCQRLATAITMTPSAELLQLTDSYLERYAKLKAARALLDFDDLQIETARLLAIPEVSHRWRQRFALTMVDEFQDTDALQLRLVEAISGRNLCTVGDERQSIYRFRGADIDVYRGHVEAMRAVEAASSTLSVNYRSHPHILDFVNSVFSWEGLFGGELVALSAGRAEPAEPLLEPDSPRTEVLIAETGRTGGPARTVLAEQIAQRVLGLLDRGFKPEDVVVLVHRYRHAEAYASPLRSLGVDCVIVGGNRFFGCREVHALISALRVLANRSDDAAAALLLAGELCELSDDALLALSMHARATGAGLWEAATAVTLPPGDARRLAVVRRAIADAVSVLGTRPLSEIIVQIVETCGLDLKLLAGSVAGEQAYANVLKMVRLAEQFEKAAGRGPAAFVDHLRLKEELGDHEAPAALISEGAAAVRIMSVHASKGLEFPVVVIPELGANPRAESSPVRFSTGESPRLSMTLPGSWGGSSELRHPAAYVELCDEDAAAAAEELKRLFYVACTRAKEALVLAGSRTFGASTSKTMLNWLVDALGISLVPDAETSVNLSGGACVQVTTFGVQQIAELTEDAEQTGAEDWLGDADRWFDAVEGFTRAEHSTPEERRRLSYSALRRHLEEADAPADRPSLRGGSEAGEAASRVGSATHAALQLFGEVRPLDDERFGAVAMQFRLDAEQRRRMEAAVEQYRSSAVAAEVRAKDRVAREASFGIRLGSGDDRFMLEGMMDLYVMSEADALVVDFKTGVWPGDEAEQRFGLQARCYALAAIRDGAKRVEAVFVGLDGRAQEPSTARFRFRSEEATPIEKELLSIARSIVSANRERSTGS